MSDQRGMTLVELLVAISLSTIVIFVASTMIISALNVTNQVTGRMTAVAQGRTGIETLLGQLNSGCLVNNLSPVQASTSAAGSSLSPSVTSDAYDLVFVTGLNDSTNPTPTLHVVNVSSAGALLDYAYAYSGTAANVTAPKSWTFNSTPSQILNLAQHVTAGANPYFTYYAYSSSTNSLQGASALATPLTTTTAPTVAEVDLDFRFAPSAAGSNPTAISELQDSAVFSLTAQSAGTVNSPCE